MVFPEGGMGLTLTKELDGGCSVTKVVPGGVAHSRGVALGQRVCGELRACHGRFLGVWSTVLSDVQQ